MILLANQKENVANIISWKTKKISRVCCSIKTAETRALDDAIDDGVHVARMIKEIYNGHIDLRNPAQLPVIGFTDLQKLMNRYPNTPKFTLQLFVSIYFIFPICKYFQHLYII